MLQQEQELLNPWFAPRRSTGRVLRSFPVRTNHSEGADEAWKRRGGGTAAVAFALARDAEGHSLVCVQVGGAEGRNSGFPSSLLGQEPAPTH